MEEINEGWVEVMTTNENKSKDLNLKEIFLKAQSSKTVVVMCMH